MKGRRWGQVLPFASEETISQLERNIAAAGSITDMMHAGLDAAGISSRLFAGLGVAESSFSLTPRYVRTSSWLPLSLIRLVA